jgi:hypothetical protein
MTRQAWAGMRRQFSHCTSLILLNESASNVASGWGIQTGSMTRAASTQAETAHEMVPIYGVELPPLARGKAVSSTPEGQRRTMPPQ